MQSENPTISLGENAITDQFTAENSITCSRCKGRVLISEGRKMCYTCREKQQQRRLQGAKQRQAGPSNNIEVLEPDRKRVNDTSMQVMNKRIKERNDVVQTPGTNFSDVNINQMLKGDLEEYQTVSDMYQSLTAKSASKAITFGGTFSIISNPAIGNRARAEMTAQDVSKIVGTPLALSKRWKDLFAPNGFTSVFSCSCAADSAPNNPEFRQSHGPACDGKIVVKVLDDTSHDLGIAGQKIIVFIRHS